MKLKLTDNLFLKLISLGVAVLIWLVVMNINDAEKSRSFSKSVKLINTEVITENGKVFRVVEGTDYVNVRVRARKSVVDSLESEDFILTADMRKDLQLNDSMVGISVECKNKNINVAEDVTLSRRNVEVSIEDSATEQFQVHVRKQGDENEGLVVGSLIPEQTIIKITGPVSLVQRIKVVEAMVDVTGIPATTVRNCELRIYDSAGGEIDNTYLNYVGKTDGIAVTISLLNTKTVDTLIVLW
jgi:YbbR domain-containing protein